MFVTLPLVGLRQGGREAGREGGRQTKYGISRNFNLFNIMVLELHSVAS